jgi:hypothetical protein
MTNLLLKNGTGTDANRALFKKVRPTLTEDEQRNLAAHLGLTVINAEPLITEPPVRTYKVLVQVPVLVEATSEQEARDTWNDETNADNFDDEDVEVVSVTLQPQEDDEGFEDLEEDYE